MSDADQQIEHMTKKPSIPIYAINLKMQELKSGNYQSAG
ncbi:hypothetical protein XBKQ1_2420031 [Xenorhabdus bovienii str. kraussei Quebec]|uniref:Uncharacterized protein n=1 Tax=Xenorhabdus bovienii str. kraussei Quebec TaxID=1398203 RepID=A0A077PHB9_XENBV|nr:hypothetical protein XBKQ1_2420031 [Xenorhabdus bovienii str. kraussei Quebec]